jgi:hypothetical protein
VDILISRLNQTLSTEKSEHSEVIKRTLINQKKHRALINTEKKLKGNELNSSLFLVFMNESS